MIKIYFCLFIFLFLHFWFIPFLLSTIICKHICKLIIKNLTHLVLLKLSIKYFKAIFDMEFLEIIKSFWREETGAKAFESILRGFCNFSPGSPSLIFYILLSANVFQKRSNCIYISRVKNSRQKEMETSRKYFLRKTNFSSLNRSYLSNEKIFFHTNDE